MEQATTIAATAAANATAGVAASAGTALTTRLYNMAVASPGLLLTLVVVLLLVCIGMYLYYNGYVGNFAAPAAAPTQPAIGSTADHVGAGSDINNDNNNNNHGGNGEPRGEAGQIADMLG